MKKIATLEIWRPETPEEVEHGWYTPDNFEATFGKTDRNIGSLAFPLSYSRACDCLLRGWE